MGSLAPHNPTLAPTRHLGSFDGWTAPRTPSFNEADVSDKPRWIQDNLSLMTDADFARLDELYRARLRTMLAVEELLEGIDHALRDTGRLDDTYVIFVSDHGVQQGHHRFRQGKSTPYEPTIQIPLMMRGPGIAVGETRQQMVLNVDLPSTIPELAGVQAPGFVDGRSLVGLLRDGSIAPEAWREAVLLEHPATPGESGGIPGWWGLRTLDATFAEYETGETEYYDLRTDPDQLDNLAGRVDPALLETLSSRLASGLRCSGASCG